MNIETIGKFLDFISSGYIGGYWELRFKGGKQEFFSDPEEVKR